MAQRDTDVGELEFYIRELLDDHGKTQRMVPQLGPSGRANGRRVLVLTASVDHFGIMVNLADGTQFCVAARKI